MRSYVWILALCCLFILGCKQSEGDRCQVTSDCQEGLECVIPAGENRLVGGVCARRGADGGIRDATIDGSGDIGDAGA